MAFEKIITEEFSQELSNDYKMLRQYEHRVQMIHDQQTHMIPTEVEDQNRFFILNKELEAVLQQNDINYEVMPTKSAIKTFNILTNEARKPLCFIILQ